MEGKIDMLEGIDADIKEILYGYVKAQSFTYTKCERDAADFLTEYLSKIPYFAEHEEYYGTYPIEKDPFGREVCYGMVKGRGKKAVVLLHHNDVVGIEDFKLLKHLAFEPDQLRQELLLTADSLPVDAKKDLLDDTFLFGRGTADMKGGGAVQLALLERYSRMKEFEGTVIVIAVPDEENLSAGMRAAVKLLAELKVKYDLDYKMMINSEPHQRKDPEVGIFSEGSVGKLMPFVYVRGYLSHAGKVFEGFNPLSLMSRIVTETELNMDFSDVAGRESAPPPTWLYFKDSKDHYDVSMPLSAAGCFSILTLYKTPAEAMEQVRSICETAFEKTLEKMNASWQRFAQNTGMSDRKLAWKVKVTDFAAVYEEAKKNHGEVFEEKYAAEKAILSERMKKSEINIIESNFALVELVMDYIDDLAPVVVYGLIPPYYPSVSNFYRKEKEKCNALTKELEKYVMERYGQKYEKEYFYTGISDLSYTGIKDSDGTAESLKRAMPLLGEFYDIPVGAIQEISMPCMNIGPWGKDFHKITERVCKEDLYIRTPRILDKAISLILQERR